MQAQHTQKEGKNETNEKPTCIYNFSQQVRTAWLGYLNASTLQTIEGYKRAITAAVIRDAALNPSRNNTERKISMAISDAASKCQRKRSRLQNDFLDDNVACNEVDERHQTAIQKRMARVRHAELLQQMIAASRQLSDAHRTAKVVEALSQCSNRETQSRSLLSPPTANTAEHGSGIRSAISRIIADCNGRMPSEALPDEEYEQFSSNKARRDADNAVVAALFRCYQQDIRRRLLEYHPDLMPKTVHRDDDNDQTIDTDLFT